MLFQTVLKKMETEDFSPINYFLPIENDLLQVNQLIGKSIQIKHVGYQCLGCGDDHGIFRQGFCKKCFFESPMAGTWIMKPEESKAHLGIADRDLEFEKQMQLQPHIVYLSNTGAIKVGITRKKQLPTRWIDQGAHQALAILEVPNRYLAGVAEVALKEHISDKTNFRVMLSKPESTLDLKQHWNSLKAYVPSEVSDFIVESEVVHLNFPFDPQGKEVQSTNLTKEPELNGVLTGIKGQYLLFEDGRVFNVRSHEGYQIELRLN